VSIPHESFEFDDEKAGPARLYGRVKAFGNKERENVKNDVLWDVMPCGPFLGNVSHPSSGWKE
jgi:hypothetical protein